MDVSRLLDARAREILCDAILKGMEAPSDVESRAARDESKKQALQSEAALDANMKRWSDVRTQLENHRAVIDPVKATAARELDEQKVLLRVQAATIRQAMEDHGIDRVEFGKKMDENDKLDAEIGQLLHAIEGEKEKGKLWDVNARHITTSICNAPAGAQQRLEGTKSDDVEMM